MAVRIRIEPTKVTSPCDSFTDNKDAYDGTCRKQVQYEIHIGKRYTYYRCHKHVGELVQLFIH